jgi:hypothetical protein
MAGLGAILDELYYQPEMRRIASNKGTAMDRDVTWESIGRRFKDAPELRSLKEAIDQAPNFKTSEHFTAAHYKKLAEASKDCIERVDAALEAYSKHPDFGMVDDIATGKIKFPTCLNAPCETLSAVLWLPRDESVAWIERARDSEEVDAAGATVELLRDEKQKLVLVSAHFEEKLAKAAV